jgi:hypothetical protein
VISARPVVIVAFDGNVTQRRNGTVIVTPTVQSINDFSTPINVACSLDVGGG